MSVLAYLFVPILVVAVAASVMWLRNRQPTSLESGVQSFRREMDALSPDAAPARRRVDLGTDAPDRVARPTRRPGSPTDPNGNR